MPSAQSMEEELQLSVVVSGESDYQSEDTGARRASRRTSRSSKDAKMRDRSTDVDASGETETGNDSASDGSESAAEADWEDGDEVEDEDAEADEMDATKRRNRKRKSSSVEADEDTVIIRKRRRNPGQDTDSAFETGDDKDLSQSRTMRLKQTRPPPPVSVEKKSTEALVLKMRVRPGNLKEVLSRKKRDRRDREPKRRGPGRPPKSATTASIDSELAFSALPTPFGAASYSQPFYSFFDKDTDEAKGQPYGGILTEAEADTSKTMPNQEDRRKFDQAKQIVIEEWKMRELEAEANMEVPVRKSRKNGDDASKIQCIEFGGWEIDTWYAAPYPAEYSVNRVLYICEFCLKYMNSDYVAWRHKLKCGTKHPPGDEIYRHEKISVFEVDGRKNPVYCQNLCLLAKLFLGSKTLYYDVEPFLFYVLCEFDDNGYHFVGYFSKEKRASSQNNVSCILTLPIHQRKGYGNLLIDFSYLLTRTEEKTGSPEKPLSDMGLVSYRNYWRLRMCRYFLDMLESGAHRENGLSIKQISDDTGMTADDVISALEGLRALVRDPETKLYAFRIDLEYCRQYWEKFESKGYVQLDPKALVWTPYVMGKSNAVNFELGPINTIAPREDDEAKVDEGPNGISSVGPGEGRTVSNDGSTSAGDPKPDGKENEPPGEAGDTEMEDAGDVKGWDAPYNDIPATRFEVFPAVSGSRRDRRGPGRPPGRGPGRPRGSTSRRKSGGTGRGPGRWPKGTKKADYGNATSGPGMPPGWPEDDTPGDSADGTTRALPPTIPQTRVPIPIINGLGTPVPLPVYGTSAVIDSEDDESDEEEDDDVEDEEDDEGEDEDDDDEEEDEDEDEEDDEEGDDEEEEDEDAEGEEEDDDEDAEGDEDAEVDDEDASGEDVEEEDVDASGEDV